MPAGGNSRFRGYPSRMSERQQLALILQMTSQDVPGSGSSSRSESNSVSNARSSPVHHHKNSAKSRWSNKSSELQDANTQLSQQDDRLHGLSSCDSKERNEFAGSISPDEVRQASGAESPLAAGSPAESAATCTTSAAAAAPDNPATISQDQDDCEMRGTPPQNKVDNRSTSSSSSSLSSSGIHQRSQEPQRGRVLKLVRVRSTRDEKKPIIGPCPSSISSSGGGGGINSGGALHQGQTHHHLITGTSSSRLPVLSSNQMDSSSQKSSNTGGASSSTMTGVTSSGGNSTGGANSSASSADGGDVYEFKSSKEATPVRGSSSSPNPNMDKDGKESTTSSVGGGSLCGGNQNIGSGSANPSGNPPTGEKVCKNQRKTSLVVCSRERAFRTIPSPPFVYDDEIVKCIEARCPTVKTLVGKIISTKKRSETSLTAMVANIKRYQTFKKEHLSTPIYQDTIQDLLEEFSVGRKLHAIALSNVTKNVSKDKSPGLPWISNNSTPPSADLVMTGCISLYDKYWSDVGQQLPVEDLPDCAACVHESIGTFKTTELQDDWVYPIQVSCQEARFFMPLIKEITEQRAFCSAAYGGEIMKGGMMWLDQEMKSVADRYPDCKFVILEYSNNFQYALPEWLIHDCFDIIKQKFDFSQVDCEQETKCVDGEQELRKFEKLIEYFIETPIRLTDGRRWKKSNGIPSGSLFSHLIGTMANYLVSDTIIRMATQKRPICKVVFGSKSLIVLPKNAVVNFGTLSRIALNSFNLRVDEKSYWTRNRNNIKFLGYYNQGGIPFIKTADILPRLLLPRYEKVDWTYRVSKALRFLLVSAGSNSLAHKIAMSVYECASQHDPDAVKKGIALVKKEKRKLKNLGCIDWEFSEDLFSGVSPRTNCQKLTKRVHLV